MVQSVERHEISNGAFSIFDKPGINYAIARAQEMLHLFLGENNMNLIVFEQVTIEGNGDLGNGGFSHRLEVGREDFGWQHI